MEDRLRRSNFPRNVHHPSTGSLPTSARLQLDEPDLPKCWSECRPEKEASKQGTRREVSKTSEQEDDSLEDSSEEKKHFRTERKDEFWAEGQITPKEVKCSKVRLLISHTLIDSVESVEV